MPSFGLATKITVPFVVLFAVLLTLLGWYLTREVFDEVDARIEREERFVLSVAAFPHIPPEANFLRGIRDRARGDNADAAGMEFVVLSDAAPPVTTFDALDTKGPRLAAAIKDSLKNGALFPEALPMDNAGKILVAHANLEGERYLILYTARWPAGNYRGFFLLYPQASIDAAKNRALQRIAWVGGVGLGLAALLGALVAHWISRPIRRLAAYAGRLGKGGLGERLEPDLQALRDEIGELSRAFAGTVEKLRRSQEELVQSERLAVTGKLAASVAHEIRNPLTSMRMIVQTLADRKTNDTATGEAYAMVLSEIARLELAVDELLTFARPRPAQRTPTDLNKLCAETLAFLSRQLKHAGVEAKFEPDAALPADLPLDAHKIRQGLVNLLLNAMQAIVRKGTVTLRTRWDADKKIVRIEVADTGGGIPEAIRATVFDAFVSAKPGGGGLGLAIARQIAEEHNGKITFETSDSGTTFMVELPAA